VTSGSFTPDPADARRGPEPDRAVGEGGALALAGRRFGSWDEVRQVVEVATTYWNVHKHPLIWGRRRRHQPCRQPGVAAVPLVA
jgi:hypothetical protein